MSDDFDVVHIPHEDAQAIVDWAVSAAAMVTLMFNSPVHTDAESALERLEEFIEAVQIMNFNMPDCLLGPALTIATEALEESIEEEKQVEQFKQELDKL